MCFSSSYSYSAPRVDPSVARISSLERELRISEALTSTLEDQATVYEAHFADDCKTAARELAEAGAKLIVQRGHVVVDQTMLIEHWWVKNPSRGVIIDPSFCGVRGHTRPHDKAVLEYLPLDAEGMDFDFETPYSGCDVSWGPCSLDTPCEWCQARGVILGKYPDLSIAQITISFVPASTRRLLLLQET